MPGQIFSPGAARRPGAGVLAAHTGVDGHHYLMIHVIDDDITVVLIAYAHICTVFLKAVKRAQASTCASSPVLNARPPPELIGISRSICSKYDRVRGMSDTVRVGTAGRARAQVHARRDSLGQVFNGDISGWDTSKVTNMKYMFLGATSFNASIGNWDTSKVKNMKDMFDGATSFNQDISGWDTGQVKDMENMFRGATAFSKDISGWDVEAVNTGEGDNCNNFCTGAPLLARPKFTRPADDCRTSCRHNCGNPGC